MKDKVLPVPVCTHDPAVFGISPQFALCISEYIWDKWTTHYFQQNLFLFSSLATPLSKGQLWRSVVGKQVQLMKCIQQ